MEVDIKQRVREFYNSVGWREIGEGVYQNARYEDLRLVVREYIHRCHLRVGYHLLSHGTFLLDGGSGPIQYPEYLEYSRGYRYRLCLDISELALVEARKRIGDNGLFVVGDIANQPFKDNAFEGVVSMHTVHHLPAGEQRRAFFEFHRVLRPGARAVVVSSWGKHSPIGRLLKGPTALAFRLIRVYRRLRGFDEVQHKLPGVEVSPETTALLQTPGSFTHSHSYRWLVKNIGRLPNLEVRVWRSIPTSFMRAFIHRHLLGQQLLRVLFWLEERLPHFIGRVGQYPMILFEKQRERIG